MLRFATITIGCKVNQYETQAATALLRRMGLRDADKPSAPNSSEGPALSSVEGSDLVIINTCCVTSSAAGKSRRAIRRAVRNNPDADIVILGCYATAEGSMLRQVADQTGAGGRIHVLGHHDNISSCLRQYQDQNRIMSEANPAKNSTTHVDSLCSSTGVRLPPIEIFAGRQRAFVKVQDGCDAGCTYCIIPRLRSRIWSRPTDEILREVSNLVANGHKEIVLCGVFLGAYGQSTTVRRKWTAPGALPELLRQVARIPRLQRVRISSTEPGDVTDELLNVFSDCSSVAPHLHLPLQSGSNRILKRMNRQYDAGQFLNAIQRIRETLTDAAITTDILVGFPGETESDFDATLDVARQAGVSRIHAFPFSPRPGTTAWNWKKESPPKNVVKTRCAKLSELERELAENFRRRFIGRTVETIVEQPNSKTPPNCARALTDRYIEVIFPSNEGKDLTGKVVPVHIVGLSETGLTGKRRKLATQRRRGTEI